MRSTPAKLAAERKYARSAKGKTTDARRRAKLKAAVYAFYGARCVKCGFADIRALSIDHVNGDGAAHRKTSKIRGASFYRWLISHDFPPDFQILCMNCQWIKRVENHEHV